MMGSLHTFPMRLFWRRWQEKLSKLSQHFFSDQVRELSNTPRTRPCTPEDILIFNAVRASNLMVWEQGSSRQHNN
jgi:hypothetical protein